MAIEQDKTNSAVVGTMLAIGTAAMIGGSAALVALARGEIHEQSQQFEGYANLSSVQELKAEQHQRLTSAKLPIDEARARVLAELKRDPTTASPPAATAADPALAPSASATDTAAPPTADPTATNAAASGAAAPTAPGAASDAAPTASAPGAANSAPAPSAPNP